MRRLSVLILCFVVFGSLCARAQQGRVEIDTPFFSIDVRGQVNVEIFPLEDGDTTIRAHFQTTGVEAKEVRWSVKKGCLSVDMERGLLEKKGIVDLKIYVPTLSAIYSKGAKIVCHLPLVGDNLLIETLGAQNFIKMNLEVENLTVNCLGDADIALSGRVSGATLKSKIASRIDMLHCVANNVYCRVAESSEVYVFALELLDAKVTTCGTLYYMGDPTLRLKSSALGAIISLDNYANKDVQ